MGKCQRCGGFLYEDWDGDVSCLQCARPVVPPVLGSESPYGKPLRGHQGCYHGGGEHVEVEFRCQHYDDCDTCPYSDCIATRQGRPRSEEIHEMAEKLHVTERTVYRILARGDKRYERA